MEDAAYGEMYEREESHWWFRGRRAVISSLLSLSRLPERPRLLDAGCGTGGNLLAFSALGPAVGVDPSAEATSFCRERGLSRVARGRLDALPLRGGRFDLLFACDVLEHVEDDRAALGELRRVAARDALLVVTVPAYQFLWSEHDEVLHHLRRYTAGELTDVVVASGWEPEVVTYFNSVALPAVAALRLLARNRGGRGRSDLDRTPAFLDEVLVRPLEWEARAIARGVRLPAGVSLALCCRRTA